MTQGRIISCHMENVQEGETLFEDECRPTVQFQTASGQQIAFVSSFTGGFHQGDAVSVHYHPDQPQDALLVSDMDPCRDRGLLRTAFTPFDGLFFDLFIAASAITR